jgi:hypothetical protein
MMEFRSRAKPVRRHSVIKSEDAEGNEEKVENPGIVQHRAKDVFAFVGVDLRIFLTEAVRIGNHRIGFCWPESPEDDRQNDQQDEARIRLKRVKTVWLSGRL